MTRRRLQLAAALVAVLVVTGIGIVLANGRPTPGSTDLLLTGTDADGSTTTARSGPGSDDPSGDPGADADASQPGTASAGASSRPRSSGERSRSSGRSSSQKKSKSSNRSKSTDTTPGASDATTTTTPGEPTPTTEPPGPGHCTADDLEILLQPTPPPADANPKSVALAPKVAVAGPRPCYTTSDDRWSIDVTDAGGQRVFHLSHAFDDPGAPPRVWQPGELLLFWSSWNWYLDCTAMPPFGDGWDVECVDTAPGTFTITFSAAGVPGQLFGAGVGPTPDTVVVP